MDTQGDCVLGGKINDKNCGAPVRCGVQNSLVAPFIHGRTDVIPVALLECGETSVEHAVERRKDGIPVAQVICGGTLVEYVVERRTSGFPVASVTCGETPVICALERRTDGIPAGLVTCEDTRVGYVVECRTNGIPVALSIPPGACDTLGVHSVCFEISAISGELVTLKDSVDKQVLIGGIKGTDGQVMVPVVLLESDGIILESAIDKVVIAAVRGSIVD